MRSRTLAAERAHPRSRGENPPQGSFIFHDWGSSPLTRGKLEVPVVARAVTGLIPAHAGKTATAHVGGHERTAHPHSRGENGWPARGITPNPGSSPLTRGKRDLEVLGSPLAGLIPAHAGKT